MNYAQKQLREELAKAGIELEAPKAPLRQPAANGNAAEVDRDEVRRILVSAGAPARDLEWLVPSCPSVGDTLGYHPPPAWCVLCDGPCVATPPGSCGGGL